MNTCLPIAAPAFPTEVAKLIKRLRREVGKDSKAARIVAMPGPISPKEFHYAVRKYEEGQDGSYGSNCCAEDEAVNNQQSKPSAIVCLRPMRSIRGPVPTQSVCRSQSPQSMDMVASFGETIEVSMLGRRRRRID